MLGTAASIVYQIRASGGVLVQYGAVQTYGHLDEIEVGGGLLRPLDETAFGEPGVMQARLALVIATGTLPGLRTDEVITVDGEQFEVRDGPRRRADGTSLILLANAPAEEPPVDPEEPEEPDVDP